MKIPKRADIMDTFKCPRYPDLKSISYKLCLGRQITKLAGGGNQYPECVGCHTGKQITAHFQGYQLPVKKGAKPNWNTDPVMNAENKKKAKKVEINNCEECQIKTLVKAQVNLVLDLLIDNKIDAALRRLGLLLEEI